MLDYIFGVKELGRGSVSGFVEEGLQYIITIYSTLGLRVSFRIYYVGASLELQQETLLWTE